MAGERGRLLLLLPTSTYRAPEMMAAAHRLSLRVSVGSEQRNVLAEQDPEGYLVLDFEDVERSISVVRDFSKRYPIAAVVGVDDDTTVLAAFLAKELSLPGNPVESVHASRNKRLMRERLQAAQVPIPEYHAWSLGENPQRLSSHVAYPCVLKPTTLSASQGVIRANDQAEFVQAWTRIAMIIQSQEAAPEILVESFVPGREVALEGLLDHGSLHVLAIFDKPDPLDGPYFEETIYVRPSRLPDQVQAQVEACAVKAIDALGLRIGPIHAEFRINQAGPWVLEVAARPIGGRCSRTLRFDVGASLEELILRQALGLDISAVRPDPTPSGVMMIPIPQAGVLQAVEGVEAARAVPGVEEVLITAHQGQAITPPPEGSRYLGFIFSRARMPEAVEQALRQAHQQLRVVIKPDGQEVASDRRATSLHQERAACR